MITRMDNHDETVHSKKVEKMAMYMRAVMQTMLIAGTNVILTFFGPTLTLPSPFRRHYLLQPTLWSGGRERGSTPNGWFFLVDL